MVVHRFLLFWTASRTILGAVAVSNLSPFPIGDVVPAAARSTRPAYRLGDIRAFGSVGQASTVQSCQIRPATRANLDTFAVTNVVRRRRACAAINKS
jgi:hypothetical protein